MASYVNLQPGDPAPYFRQRSLAIREGLAAASARLTATLGCAGRRRASLGSAGSGWGLWRGPLGGRTGIDCCTQNGGRSRQNQIAHRSPQNWPPWGLRLMTTVAQPCAP